MLTADKRYGRRLAAASRSFGKEAGLGKGGSGSRGGFAAGDSDDAEDGEFGESRAGNKDAVGVGAEIGGSDLNAVVEEAKQVVGDDTFESLSIGIAETDPETVEFGTAEEGFALGFVFAVKLADKINGADAGERDFFVLAIGCEQVNGIGMGEARGIEIPAERGLVGEGDDDLLVSRGWGARLQRSE